MKKNLFILIAIASMTMNVQAQVLDTLKPATGIDSAFCYFDKNGKAHLRAELNPKEIKALEDAAKQLVVDFDSNVDKLWHPWTEVEKKKFTAEERDSFKNKTEEDTRDLFIAKAEKFTTRDIAEYMVYPRNGVYYYTDQYGREKLALKEIYKDSHGAKRITVEEDVLHKPARIQITSLSRKSGHWREVKKYLNNIKNSHLYDKVSFDIGGITVSNRLVRDPRDTNRYVGTICYYQYFTGTKGDGKIYTDKTTRCVTYYVYVTVIDNMIVWNIKLGDIRATATEGVGKQ